MDLDEGDEGDEGDEEGPPPPLPDRDYLGETQHTMEQVKAIPLLAFQRFFYRTPSLA